MFSLFVLFQLVGLIIFRSFFFLIAGFSEADERSHLLYVARSDRILNHPASFDVIYSSEMADHSLFAIDWSVLDANTLSLPTVYVLCGDRIREL